MRKHRAFSRFAAVGTLVVSSLLAVGPAFAGGWARLSPTSSLLYGVVFNRVFTQHGVAVGSGGTVIYSSDYGKSWTNGSSGITNTLWDVSYAGGSNILLAVGNGGKILKSIDDGANWTNISSGVTSDLFDVDMGTVANGLAVGASGRILKTTTYGNSWSALTSGTTVGLYGVDMLSDTLTAWVVGGNGTILKTTNGGTTWTAQTSGTTQSLMAVYAVDSSLAYAVGYNRTILKTTNGGTTWTALSTTAVGATTTLYDVSFADASNGTAVGGSGAIITTTDGGANWVLQTSGTTSNLDGVFVDSANTHRYATSWTGQVLVWDATSPTTLTNVSITGGTPTNDTTPTFTWSAATDNETSVQDYQIMWDGVGAVSIGIATSYTPAPLTVGAHSIRVRAVDAAGNFGVWSSALTFSIDTTPPASAAISPTSATAGSAVTLGSVVIDSSSITACNLFINDIDKGAMTYNAAAGEYQTSYTFPSAGTYTARASCTDAAGNTGAGTGTTVSVAAGAAPGDTTAPTVTAVSTDLAMPTVGQSVTITANATDNVAVSGCTLYVNGVSQGAMTMTGPATGVATRAYTFASAGIIPVMVKCSDAVGNLSAGVTITVAVGAAAAADTTAPIVAAVTPTTATAGAALTLSTSASDNVGVASCNLWINGADQGAMILAGTNAEKSYTFAAAGTAAAQVKCLDAAGNQGIGLSTTITVLASGSTATTPSAAASSAGTTASSVVADNSATATITVTVKNSSGTALAGKTVTMISSRPGSDTVTTVSGTTNDLGQATFTVRSTTAGASTFTAVADGLTVTTVAVSFTASAGSSSTTPGPGSLIKVACPAGAAADHPCKAVYYYSAAGKRHAFPNEKVYTTWYTGFGTVVTVSQSFLASLPLGKNVTYRPGLKMVKFLTLPTVYAVSKGGVLRAIGSESAAAAIYGADWNKMIDDVSDAFYTNYLFGTPINILGDYTPTTESAAATTVEMNF